MTSLFTRDPRNPILTPRDLWWEARGVLNPGVMALGRSISMLYRAVGEDGVSRFGLATSGNGHDFERRETPIYAADPADELARLGIEDPRITSVDADTYVTFTKASLEADGHPPLAWETAAFRIRSWVATLQVGHELKEIAPILAGVTAKDAVLFPARIDGKFVALIREFPAIQLTTSTNLRDWTEPRFVLGPIANSWEAERVGTGPPPLETSNGWLLFYHANEYLRLPANERLYRMGFALLDAHDPTRVLYRHPEPIFEPEAEYEKHGPVGNVVFGTGLVQAGHDLWLYYGAGDGVIGLATGSVKDVLSLLPASLRVT